jgi:hypothetical protein
MVVDTSNVVKALKALPEVRLNLIDFCWKVVKDDGSIDLDKVMFHGKEMELYVQQARDYVFATRKALECLKKLIGEIDQEQL